MTELNIKICPLHPADVCISFDASENFDYVVLGTMSGKVYAYKTNHVFSLLSLTRSLPQYNPVPIHPYISPSGLPYRVLYPCQTISIVGRLDEKYEINHSDPESVIKASQWTEIPRYTPIQQSFPLKIDCSKQYILQSDLDHITQLTTYLDQQKQLQQSQSQSQQQQNQQQNQQTQSNNIENNNDHQHQTVITINSTEQTIQQQSAQSSLISSNQSTDPTQSNTNTTTSPTTSPSPTSSPNTNHPPQSKFDPIRPVQTEPAEYICKKLLETNTEAVKGIYIVPRRENFFNGPLVSGSIVMALGDMMLKISQTIKSTNLLNMKYQRTHDAYTCQMTYCLPYHTAAALIMPGESSQRPILLDSATQKQSVLQALPIPSSATPLFLYNANNFNPLTKCAGTGTALYLAWREFLYQDQVTALVFASVGQQKVTEALYYSESKRPIGFKQVGFRVVAIVEANHIQINNFMPIMLTNNCEDYYESQYARQNDGKTSPNQDTVIEFDSDGRAIVTQKHTLKEPLTEEQEKELIIDELTVNSCILQQLNQSKLIREKELGAMRDLIASFAQKYQINNTTTNTNNINDGWYWNFNQRQDLLSFRITNPHLFNPVHTIPPQILDEYVVHAKQNTIQVNIHKKTQDNTTNEINDDNGNDNDEYDENDEILEVRKQLFNHTYIDWINDKPIIDQAQLFQNEMKLIKNNGNNQNIMFNNSTAQNNNNNKNNTNTTTNNNTNNTTTNNNTNTTTPDLTQISLHEQIPIEKQSPMYLPPQLTPIDPTVTTSTSASSTTTSTTTTTTSTTMTQYPPPPKHFSHLGGKTTSITKWSCSGHILQSGQLTPGRHKSAFDELMYQSKTFRCIKYCAHKRGHILGVEAEYEGMLIITIATDFKIKIWYKGELICQFTNILGNLLCSSVVLIKRIGRCIYYTCCDGIYCVIMPFDLIVDVIGTNLYNLYSSLSSSYINPSINYDNNNLIQHQPIIINHNNPYQPNVYKDLQHGRYFEPRFYARPIHICDQSCCIGSQLFIQPKHKSNYTNIIIPNNIKQINNNKDNNNKDKNDNNNNNNTKSKPRGLSSSSSSVSTQPQPIELSTIGPATNNTNTIQ